MHFKEISLDNIRIMTGAESRSLFKTLGFDGELIPTPGHSEDSITLIIDKDSAFTGDLPSSALAEAYHDRVIDDSWRRIGENGVKYIYPAHDEKYFFKK
jgi:glyoxylase-like metal-dependent hydrolase (beta-lactamase superfamily II)